MEIIQEKSGNAIILKILGRISNTTVASFQSEVLKCVEQFQKVVLNMEKLEYMNSSGLRALLLAMKQIEDTDKKMLLTNVTDEIMELFEMTGFSDILVFE